MSVGMPAALMLHEFGSQVLHAFGEPAYHVGSSLRSKTWRDVDVRVLLPDDEYAALGLGNPENPHVNGKWCALTLAFSALARSMTGLPIDFQIQQQSWANKHFSRGAGHERSALGVVALRISEWSQPRTDTK